jgi:hypothetical protein
MDLASPLERKKREETDPGTREAPITREEPIVAGLTTQHENHRSPGGKVVAKLGPERPIPPFRDRIERKGTQVQTGDQGQHPLGMVLAS